MKNNQKIIRETDDFIEVELIFNVDENGHDFGIKTYNHAEYEAMINSQSTQTRISNGYALGGYTHKPRKEEKLYQFDGDACIKTLSMEWLGNGRVKHVQRIVKTDVGKHIITLLKSGIGGFSSVHHISGKKFAGFDYVHYPMFASNKLIHDNACKDGVCSFSMDDVFSDAERLVSDFSKRNGYNDEVVKSLAYLEKKMIELDPNVKIIRELKIGYSLIEKEKKQIEKEFEEYKENVSKNMDKIGLTDDWAIDVPSNMVFNIGEIEVELDKLKEVLQRGIRQKNPTTEIKLIK